MNIEQAKRQIILKVLRAIHGPILDQSEFVCCAADTAARSNVIFNYERDIFEKFIRERLEGCYTVTEWVSKQGFFTRTVDTRWKLDYRQRWVAAMIKEFSK